MDSAQSAGQFDNGCSLHLDNKSYFDLDCRFQIAWGYTAKPLCSALVMGTRFKTHKWPHWNPVKKSVKSGCTVHAALQLLGSHPNAPCMASLGPWSSCSSQDLGPWSASPLAGDNQKAGPKKKAQVVPKKSRSQGVGPPKGSRSHSRSQGVDDSKPLGLWSRASQKGQVASQGVDKSKPWGPWSKASQNGASSNIRSRSKPEGHTTKESLTC